MAHKSASEYSSPQSLAPARALSRLESPSWTENGSIAGALSGGAAREQFWHVNDLRGVAIDSMLQALYAGTGRRGLHKRGDFRP